MTSYLSNKFPIVLFSRLDEDARCGETSFRWATNFFLFFILFEIFLFLFFLIAFDRGRRRKLQALSSVDYHQEKNDTCEIKREHPYWNVDNRIFTTMHLRIGYT